MVFFYGGNIGVAQDLDNIVRLAASLRDEPQAYFLLAVEDVLPEHWEKFKTIPWLNAWRVGLKPERWESDGLFRPTSTPETTRGIYQQLRQCFVVRDQSRSASS